jgi:RecA/RadA recombinase
MQLAVNVQRPKEKGGLNGECIYIDTEGSFLSYRFIKMINDEDALAYLDKIHLFRVYNHTELIALIRQLPDILAQKFQNKVKLIIIDSIAYHFRMNTMDSRRRDVFLPNLAHLLIRVATNHTLAMVVTNHVTENILDGTWIPALGSAWGNWCAFRLFLFRRRQFRFGYLYKNIEDEDSIVPVQFCIKVCIVG